jgi:hypothetical protein
LTGLPPDKHVAPGNNVWKDNVYNGPWGWYAYLYGTCSPLPTDSATNRGVPTGACGVIPFATWQSNWQQDASSAYSAGAA